MQSPTPEKCHCVSAGFCPLYRKVMDTNNIGWCKGASPQDREYYIGSYKGPVALNQDAVDFLSKYEGNNCQVDTSEVQIAVLGHSKQQFDTIKDQSYLKKVYLDDLDLGKYSRFQSNAYAESRAFFCDDLFDSNVKYVGTVTASWNIKYRGLSPIDDFHNWDAAGALLRSQADNVMLCANLDRPAVWFGETFIKTPGADPGGILGYLGFSKEQRAIIETVLLGDLKLRVSEDSRAVAMSNQFICHKNLYNRYIKFLREHEILDVLTDLFSSDHMLTNKPATNVRPVAFMVECVTMIWLSMQEDILIIPTEIRSSEWYDTSKIRKRHEWYHTEEEK